MNKSQLIQQINQLAGEYQEGYRAYNISGLTISELQTVVGKADKMVQMANVSKMLLEEFNQNQIVNALLDGTDDPILSRAIELKRSAQKVASEINVY